MKHLLEFINILSLPKNFSAKKSSNIEQIHPSSQMRLTSADNIENLESLNSTNTRKTVFNQVFSLRLFQPCTKERKNQINSFKLGFDE